jgi:hypothetical protein
MNRFFLLLLSGPGAVHLPVGAGAAGRGEVRAGRVRGGAPAQGRHPAAGTLPHARHDDPAHRHRTQGGPGKVQFSSVSLCTVFYGYVLYTVYTHKALVRCSVRN